MTAGLHINFTGDLTDESPALQAVPDVETPVVTTPATAAPVITNPAGATTQPNGLREFEKAQVARTEIKISGSATINTNDSTEVSLDDRIRVVGQFRVTKITHSVDKNGEVVRTQYVTPVDDLELTPFDPADPNDNGIVRVRP